MDSTQIKKNARGYIRVSTAIQKETGESLETQMKQIQAYCAYKNLNLVEVYRDEGISGKNLEGRPEMLRLLREIQKEDNIIVSNLSRFSRNVLDSLVLFKEFDSKGVNFICLSPEIDFSTNIGRTIFTILMSFAEYERKNTIENIKVNMQRLSHEGKLRTKAPFGWKFVGKDKDMEEDTEQQAVLQIIKNLYSCGSTFNRIAVFLNCNGYNKTLSLNKKNQSKEQLFYAATIKNILVQHGLVQSTKPIKTLEQRIISWHKDPNVIKDSEEIKFVSQNPQPHLEKNIE